MFLTDVAFVSELMIVAACLGPGLVSIFHQISDRILQYNPLIHLIILFKDSNIIFLLISFACAVSLKSQRVVGHVLFMLGIAEQR